MSRLRHDAVFWRRLARWGASQGPGFWLRYSPPVFGWAAAALVPRARRAVLRNLRAVRGERTSLRDALDVCVTFGSYASCLAEVLSSGSKNARVPRAIVDGDWHIRAALRQNKGLILATAHTAGWELVGPLLSRDHQVGVMLAMQAEDDREARRLQDEARVTPGLEIVHVGADPLASLTLLHQLKKGGIVALQIDRTPPGIRTRKARILGTDGVIPEGPLRLAQVSGAPVVPAFSARTGFRAYRVEVGAPLLVPRRASSAELDAQAQALADAMTRFVRAHPTQWFHFDEK